MQQISNIEKKLQVENFQFLSQEIDSLKDQNIELGQKLKKTQELENRSKHLGT